MIIGGFFSQHLVNFQSLRTNFERHLVDSDQAQSGQAPHPGQGDIAHPFDKRFPKINPRRIERYLVLIEGSGARAVAVLTKLDKVENAASAAMREELRVVRLNRFAPDGA